jgi:hypothetical protein
MPKFYFKSLHLAVAIVFCTASAPAASAELSLADLPKEAKEIISEVRSNCKEFNYKEASNQLAGVSVINFPNDTARFIVIDAKDACETVFKANGACTTDGCNIKIFREGSSGVWDSVFDETVLEFRAEQSQNKKSQALIVALRGGAPKCRTDRSKSCIFHVQWANKKFNWRRTR